MPVTTTKTSVSVQSDSTPMGQIETLMEKKSRNLEKRKQKLEQLQSLKIQGKELEPEQVVALGKLDEVEQQIEMVKELSKQFDQISLDARKAAKQAKRKELKDRVDADKSLIREFIRIQDVLTSFGTSEIRQDFELGQNSALKLTTKQFNLLDAIYAVLVPQRSTVVEEGGSWMSAVDTAATCAPLLIQGSPKPIDPENENFKHDGSGTPVTYKEIRALLDTVLSCGYFEQTSRSHTPGSGEGSEGASQSDEPVVQQPGLTVERSSVPCDSVPIENGYGGGDAYQHSVPQPVQVDLSAPRMPPSMGAVMQPSDNRIAPNEPDLGGITGVSFLQDDQTQVAAQQRAAMFQQYAAYGGVIPPQMLNGSSNGMSADVQPVSRSVRNEVSGVTSLQAIEENFKQQESSAAIAQAQDSGTHQQEHHEANSGSHEYHNDQDYGMFNGGSRGGGRGGSRGAGGGGGYRGGGGGYRGDWRGRGGPRGSFGGRGYRGGPAPRRGGGGFPYRGPRGGGYANA